MNKTLRQLMIEQENSHSHIEFILRAVFKAWYKEHEEEIAKQLKDKMFEENGIELPIDNFKSLDLNIRIRRY